LGVPLVNEDRRYDDEGSLDKIAEHDSNHHNRFAESHFIGDESAAHVAERVRPKFVMENPLDSVILVLFMVHFGTVEVFGKSSHSLFRDDVIYSGSHFGIVVRLV
jgi:hypothetical protein